MAALVVREFKGNLTGEEDFQWMPNVLQSIFRSILDLKGFRGLQKISGQFQSRGGKQEEFQGVSPRVRNLGNGA